MSGRAASGGTNGGGALDRLVAERDAALAEVERLKRQLVEVERLADRDPLTPVLNRRAFMRELSRAAAFCGRYGAPASLVYLDLDGFKAVNDRFGHAAGDAVLAWVASGLVERVRESDVVGRLGGDEFAVLLLQVDGGAALTKAQALAGGIGSEPTAFEGRAITVQAAFGVRDYEAGITPARWLAEADAAMFLNKGERRER
jgi:diguanylate cyclase (GGDEF)-like protein